MADTAAAFDRVRAACEVTGRELVLSVAHPICVGRDDAELARRAAAIGRDLDDLRANAIAGTPAEVVDRIGRFAEVGATRFYLQVLDLADLDHLDLVAERGRAAALTRPGQHARPADVTHRISSWRRLTL